ncbi:hypothetical protein [Aliivibrio fischeri]|uniref:hypothetical protein n=1 Tax=Aliivibrio fischeri TaxID=668 RepID=UPI00080E9BAD|nr:hypothetical protein [Aliivibrio fischeri]OCH02204.1 hypothetical protein A6E10_17710 [Aliivibrio fischeri]
MSQTNLNESTRDIQLVINSIVAMTLEAPKSLVISLSVYSSITGVNLLVWEGTCQGMILLSESVYFNEPTALDDAIDLESKLAELIIEARDDEEVAA